jgi:hypothetical protein
MKDKKLVISDDEKVKWASLIKKVTKARKTAHLMSYFS